MNNFQFVGFGKWLKALVKFPKQIHALIKAWKNIRIACNAKFDINNPADVRLYEAHVEWARAELDTTQIIVRAYIKVLTFGLVRIQSE